MHLDFIDKKLIGLVQREFPLTRAPYSDLGLMLGIDGSEVISRIEQLKAVGIIRQISLVLDARRLGYRPTLVGMRVGEAGLDRAERLISQHPGVSHGYERDHYFNLWFTLSVPPEADIESELERLTSAIAPESAFALPAIKVFKIGAYFELDGDGKAPRGATTSPGGSLPEKVALSQPEKSVLGELQADLPLVPTPFYAMALRSGMEVDDFLAQCQSLLQRGIMRRFGAAINHNRAGFNANAMACWVVFPEMIEDAGRKLASLPEVSHCYERKTHPLWQYNLFAMVHAQSRETCLKIVADVSQQLGLTDQVSLFSTREFKKTRVKYSL